MADKKGTAVKAAEEIEVVDKEKFINKKLNVLNQKGGANFERAAVRVVENNK